MDRGAEKKFMSRTERWSFTYPDRRSSGQLLRDNAQRFRMEKEIRENQRMGEEELVEIRKYFEDNMEYKGFEEFSDVDEEEEEEKEELWDNRKKLFLTQIDECERRKGRGFTKRMKERWDETYPHLKEISTQNLRDNTARFKKQKRPVQPIKSTGKSCRKRTRKGRQQGR